MSIFKRAVSLFLSGIIVLSIPGCAQETPKSFDEYTKDIFISSVSSDGKTLHSFLKDPEAFGIKEKPLLGVPYLEETIDGDQTPEQAIKELESFDYDTLSEEQQRLYDILKYNVEMNKELEGLEIYDEINSSQGGVQASLPMELAEYRFYNEDDIKNYLALLEDVPRFFEDDIAFQKKKSEAGTFMGDNVLEEVLRTGREFFKNPDENVLLQSFTQRIEKLEGISEEKKKTYTEKNDKLVRETVLPAFEKLMNELETLKGTGKTEAGLCNLEKGKEYYEYLVKSQTGVDRSVEEISSDLDKMIATLMMEYVSMAEKDPEIFDKWQAIDMTSLVPADPKEAVQWIRDETEEYFPPLGEIPYIVTDVPKALEENTSAAFYLLPPYDAPAENSIYINGKYGEDTADILSTLGHEGYPGHMYQINYYRGVNNDPCRYIMGSLGYTEGWAIYVQQFAFDALDIDNTDIKRMMFISDFLFGNLIAARVDIGVHYEGWDFEKVKEYFAMFGLTGMDDAIHDSYLQILASPAQFLPYSVGYMEVEKLKEHAQEELGDKFNLVEFHKAFLDCGPAPFSIVSKEIDKYIAKAKTAELPPVVSIVPGSQSQNASSEAIPQAA